MFTSRGDRGSGWRGARQDGFVSQGEGGRGGHGRGGRGRGGRGRGGRGEWNSPKAKHVPPPAPDIKKHPLGNLLKTLYVSDLDPVIKKPPTASQITNLKYVTSYNWLNSKVPAVMVPGKPPAWTPLKEARRLKEDSGQYFRDPNGARFPHYPTEPAVQAILEFDPTFHTSEIQIFACGSTMGNLLRFVRSSNKQFRFNLEMVGDTLFFVRKENSPTEVIEDIRGFGHTFPEAYTTWEKEVQGSESHQRLVQYEFGGFKCLVRFECDGYLKEPTASHENQVLNQTSDADDLLRVFEANSVSQCLSNMEDSLNIKVGGCEVPQCSIFDLKTRSGKWNRDIDMGDILPALWLKQVPNFIIAYHNGAGLFQDIRVQDVRKDLEAWEQENEEAIQRLAALLHQIMEIAKNDNRGLLEVYCPSDRLEIRRQHGDGSYSLPHSLKAKWEGFAEQEDLFSENDGGVRLTGNGGYDFSYNDFDSGSDSDNGEKDFTACSADSCGYCGSCSY